MHACGGHHALPWQGSHLRLLLPIASPRRQGMGVTGGTPMGFDIGQPAGAAGSTLAGVDLGVRGMRVGGQRRLLVPPNLGYGNKGVGEIPPNSTLQVDVELLSIKTNSIGFRTKLVEG